MGTLTRDILAYIDGQSRPESMSIQIDDRTVKKTQLNELRFTNIFAREMKTTPKNHVVKIEWYFGDNVAFSLSFKAGQLQTKPESGHYNASAKVVVPPSALVAQDGRNRLSGSGDEDVIVHFWNFVDLVPTAFKDVFV